MIKKHTSKQASIVVYIRNFVFGVEDSLVSTVGLLSGIAAGGATGRTIFLTGTVLIFVEAFSMAVGSLLSEQTVEEYQKRSAEVSLRLPVIASIIMFFSYFLAGFIPLVPYVLFTRDIALWISIGAALGALFFLGFVSGKFFHRHVIRHGLVMLFMGGMAIFVGTMVGVFVQNLEL